MLEIPRQQYEWISSVRQNVFAFLEELPPQKLHQALPEFGRGTIIRTHVETHEFHHKGQIVSMARHLASRLRPMIVWAGFSSE
ncbi:hypothetical protein [Paenibacillus glycanilyticus]|uniref:hypothetical protein n=1 Tax=Paenibacillus glycanilyticus TaxID=126569 RepID=UPI003EB6AA3B